MRCPTGDRFRFSPWYSASSPRIWLTSARARPDQALPDPMEILQILLRDGFGCHEAHGWAEDGLTNRLGIIEVVLLLFMYGLTNCGLIKLTS